MIYRTPISQADLARAAHGRRIRRVAARNRELCHQNKLRREVNMLCEENGMPKPFPDFSYFSQSAAAKKEDRKTLMAAAQRAVRSWFL